MLEREGTGATQLGGGYECVTPVKLCSYNLQCCHWVRRLRGVNVLISGLFRTVVWT